MQEGEDLCDDAEGVEGGEGEGGVWVLEAGERVEADYCEDEGQVTEAPAQQKVGLEVLFLQIAGFLGCDGNSSSRSSADGHHAKGYVASALF